MGLNDLETEGEYRWITDQSAAAWFDWLPGDPNNYNNEDCCLFFADRGTYEWVDAPCSWDEKPLCERRYKLLNNCPTLQDH